MGRLITAASLLGLTLLWAWGCEQSQPAVKGVSPGLGLTSGGTHVEIGVSGFDGTESVDVYFGDFKAHSVVLDPGGSIETTAPATEREGPVDVRIIVDGQREFLVSGAFQYVRSDRMAECVNISRHLNGKEPVTSP